MNSRNRSRRSVLPKLGMGFLFVLSALVPSVASAGHSRPTDNFPWTGTLCTPDANHCTTLTGDALNQEVVKAGFPQDLQVSCTDGGSGFWCTRQNVQWWRIIWAYPHVAPSDFYVVQPAQGVPGGFPNYTGTLTMDCVETSDYEDYTCSASTGGQWGSWVLKVKY
jgi:hypothetical protein